MPGRSFSTANGYRYGFNGKENDSEVKGIEGSQQDYGMRIYDPRLGRFLSVDPLTLEYPWYTPYQFAGNTPIQAIDLDGKEPDYIISKYGGVAQPLVRLYSIISGMSAQTINEVYVTRMYNANKNLNAETWSQTDMRTNTNSGNSPNEWVRTIGHELTHVGQFQKNPFPAWLNRLFYGMDKSKVGYKNTVEEIEAFRVGDIYESLANKYDIGGILANEKTTYQFKILKMEQIGYTYQIENLQKSINTNMEKAAEMDKAGKTDDANGFRMEAQILGNSLKSYQEKLAKTNEAINTEEKKTTGN